MAVSRVYVGDVGTRIVLLVGEDVSAATKVAIRVSKPGTPAGGEFEWVGSVGERPNEIVYVTQPGDFDKHGMYRLQAYVELPTWRGRGETVNLDVRKAYE